ncbi:MAG TPA: class I SAM-dependent methyltransferase, partial [Casimicrobiaceae bacterium]
EFYDRFAPLYDLIFADWDESMRRQGEFFSREIASRWPQCRRILDVSCGIGTQSIAMARHGYDVTSSDISPAAVARARTEATARGLEVALSVCDMREAFLHHGGGFDVVMSCDNSVPHLQTDADILVAFGQMLDCLRPGGGCVVTVRDYGLETRGRGIIKPVRCATRDGRRYVLIQVWDFDDDGTHYDFTTYVIEEGSAQDDVVAHAMRSRYYAIETDALAGLMRDAGFEDVACLADGFYQPVLVGTRPAA